jgi:threonine dehydratase
MGNKIMELLREIIRAETRIHSYIRETPLDYSLPLSRSMGIDIFLKMENLQFTGSFKARGAMNKVLVLGDKERQGGVVAASTGNHGAAVAFAAGKVGAKSIVFVPENASSTKVEAMQRLGAEVRFRGEDSLVAEMQAREYASQNGMIYISPYNDEEVIAGQGTAGVEIARALDRVDRLFVSLGGGGLISGIACYLKAVNPRVQVVACSPQNSCVMIESLKAGAILDLESKPTLSDGTAGGVEPGAITFELCRSLVDECVTVSEDEIADSMRSFIESHHILIEGSAAVALAALKRSSNGYRNNVVVLCGGNVSLKTLKSIL